MDKTAPLIPMEDFFRNPDKSSFKISPNGNHIAYMKPWKTRMNVYVLDIKTNNETRLTSSEERGIYEHGDPKTQYLKLIEEAGEVGRAILKNDDNDRILIGVYRRTRGYCGV